MKKKIEEDTIKSITELLYLLESDPVRRQTEGDKITLLWDTLRKITKPVVVVKLEDSPKGEE